MKQSTEESRIIQIVGCGDIGRRVAQLCRARGDNVSAWVKSARSENLCRSRALACQRIDLDQPFTLLPGEISGEVLYTIPPPPGGVTDTRLAALLEKFDPAQIEKFVLISTTGVYGDCGGAWVDEKTPVQPVARRALRRADAEATLQNWATAHGISYLILRVPGIYAPDRLPLERLAKMQTVLAREQAPWSNRIHADDLAAACCAALRLPVSDEIINIADDSPSTMSDYFFTLADYAGLPRPREISLSEARQTLSPGMLSYLAESRRIDNRKMKSLLQLELRYPTLQAGLAEKNYRA